MIVLKLFRNVWPVYSSFRMQPSLRFRAFEQVGLVESLRRSHLKQDSSTIKEKGWTLRQTRPVSTRCSMHRTR